jgi:hypothetical protein
MLLTEQLDNLADFEKRDDFSPAERAALHLAHDAVGDRESELPTKDESRPGVFNDRPKLGRAVQ